MEDNRVQKPPPFSLEDSLQARGFNQTPPGFKTNELESHGTPQKPTTSAQALALAKEKARQSEQSPLVKRNAREMIEAAQAEMIVKSKLNQVRITFQKSLAKLGNNDTRDIGVNELHLIIDNNLNAKCLRVFLSLLCEKYKGISPSNKELLVLLFGYIAKSFKTQLLDPLDKPPSLIKSIARVVDAIHFYLRENGELIHRGCAASLIEVYQHCADFKDDLQTIQLIFYEPLASHITAGSDKMAQVAASHCILQFFVHLSETQQLDTLKFLFPKFVTLFAKAPFECPDFISALTVLLRTCGIKYLVGNLQDIFRKLTKILNSVASQIYQVRVRMTEQSKIEVCILLALMAKELRDVADIVIGYYHREVVGAIERAVKDRVVKVQQAAVEARQEWKRLEMIHGQLEKKKTTQELANIPPEQLIRLRTGAISKGAIQKQTQSQAALNLSNDGGYLPRPKSKKFSILRQLSRAQRARELSEGAVETTPVDQIQENHRKMRELKDKGNWGSAARAANFLKKRTGVGGGHLGSHSPPPAVARRPKSPPDRQSILAMIKKSVIKLGQDNDEGQIFHNLKDIRREVKLEQQRQRDDDDINSNQIRTEPPPQDILSEVKQPRFNESEPSHLPSPRIEDDPDNPLRNLKKMQANLQGNPEIKEMRQQLQEGLDKMEEKMDNLEKKVATANRNASIIRGFKAEEELKKDIESAQRQSEQAESQKQLLEYQDQPKELKHPEALMETQGIPKSQVHPPQLGSPAMRDSLQFATQKQSIGSGTFQANAPSFKPAPVDLLVDSPLTQEWLRALNDLKNQEFQSAYRRVLELNDDIYLLRLASLTGPLTNRLSSEVGRLVTLRLNQIARSDMVATMMLNWTQALVGCPVTASALRKEEMNEVLDSLYYLQGVEQVKANLTPGHTNSGISDRAAWTYQNLKKFQNL